MFDSFDPVLLARIQFAFTVSFHFLFPAVSIGLASYLAVLNGMHYLTGRAVYLTLFRYWVKIFAVVFVMGVVSGIVMSYQFGTNWSGFSDKAGPVIGAPMAFEVLSAFFLEAGFLGIMLFGRDKVGPGLHLVATCMVAGGTALSAFWILSVNSWMHTPAGFSVAENGQFMPEDWVEIIFNPSFPYRFAHALIASYLTTAFIVGATGAWHLLRARRAGEIPRGASLKMLSMALWMILFTAPVQIVSGDLHGLNTLEHQPVKVMAMEGHFQSYPEGAPLYLFGIPNEAEQRLDYPVAIPQLGSLILKHDPDAPMDGLDTVDEAERPPVALVFWSFRVMVGIGVLMLLTGLWGLLARMRGTMSHSPWLHRALVAMGPSGLVAVIAGWITTEVGRQPYTVYGHLRTIDSVAPLSAGSVGASLMAFVVVYFVVFGAAIFYLLRLMHKPPQDGTEKAPPAPGVALGAAQAEAAR